MDLANTLEAENNKYAEGVDAWYEHYQIFQNLEMMKAIRDALKAAHLIVAFSPSWPHNREHLHSIGQHKDALTRRIKELEATVEA